MSIGSCVRCNFHSSVFARVLLLLPSDPSLHLPILKQPVYLPVDTPMAKAKGAALHLGSKRSLRGNSCQRLDAGVMCRRCQRPARSKAGARGEPPVALINVDLNASTLLGVALVVSGVTLYQVRSFRPESARDTDIFFGSVSILVGGILVFQGWRLDPILLFGQLCTAASALYFGYEAVRLRGLEVRALGRAEEMGSSPPQPDEISGVYYEPTTDEEGFADAFEREAGTGPGERVVDRKSAWDPPVEDWEK